MTPALVVVAVPNEKRTLALLRAAERQGGQVRCVPWSVAIASPASVGAAGRPGDYLRVESPGADGATWHALATLGGDARVIAPGEWRPGRAWFRGLTRFFDTLDANVGGLRTTHPSEHVLAMTDKRVCAQRLREAGVPVPEVLPTPCCADDLRDVMRAHECHAVYVKARWGSSGAGVSAYRWSGRRERLTTTVSLEGDRLFNRRRLSHYDERARIDAVLDPVLRDGAFVQRWIPKAGHDEGPMDFRVLVIDGSVAQSVARVGRGTITNLHLGARRVAIEEATSPFGHGKVAEVHAVCLRAAACFPEHRSIGVDVMIDTRGTVFVLECNAWGDYLPNLLVDGLDSYDLALRGMFSAHAGSVGTA